MRTTFSILILLLVLSSFAQDGLQFNFTHYTAQSGLISYQTNTIAQDDKGFIWIGTTNGLQRFDGIRFKTFIHADGDPSSIPSNPVWQLLVDKKKNLWVLLADGRIGIFNTSTFRFKEIPALFSKPVTPNTFAKKLLMDEDGNIFYLIAGSEVITYNEQRNNFSAINNFIPFKKEWNVIDFIPEAAASRYWMSIENKGLAVYNRETGKLSYKGNNTENISAIEQHDPSLNYYSLFIDKQKRLWSMHWSSKALISCFDAKPGSFILKDIDFTDDVKAYYDTKGFFQQHDGSVWIRGLLVLARFNETEKKFEFVHNGYTNDNSIVYEQVHCLYEDKEHNIWVATDNNGLYFFAPQREFFTRIKHINRLTGKTGKGSPLSFIKTKNGDLLVGTWDDGLYKYDNNFTVVPANIRGIDNKGGPFIWNMCASKDSNTLWLASQPGFYSINQQKQSGTYYNPVVLGNKTVRQIAEDKNGMLWLGMQEKGLFKFNPVKRNTIDEAIYQLKNIPETNINKITIDHNGNLWIGTPEDGLFVIDPANDKTILHFGINEKGAYQLTEKGISSILDYDDSTIIITTATRVIKYNTLKQQLNVIGKSSQVSGFITAMEKDKDGYLWISTTSALYRVSMPKMVFMKFDRTDGLDNEHFVQSSSYKLPDGRLLFGTTNDMIIFDPAKIKEQIKGINPIVQITDIKLENESINVDSVASIGILNLPYKSNSFVLEFSPLTYSTANLIKYKMEGLEDAWTTASGNASVTYNFLPPGNYKFIIKTIDENGNESPEKVLLVIEVATPFWKTWWFYSFIILLTGFILFWIDKERMKRKELLLQMRTEIADDLHKDINTALGNINILSEMARLKADTDPQKSKEFIEQIHNKSHTMMIAMDDMLWNIDPSNDNMSKLILRLKEYIDAISNRNGVTIDMLAEKTAINLPLNMRLRKEIYWLFRSGVTNVVKTGGNNCRIYINYEKPWLIYQLEFDTATMDMLQMNNLRQRQELADKLKSINAKLEMQTHQHSAAFILKIPV